MPGSEAQVLADIRERIVRVETKIDAMTDVKTTAEEAKDKAQEANLSVKSAHHRIDEIADNLRWLWRTVVGAILVGAITAFIKFNGG
ncbi:hemolysin XhlA family protein [Cohnella herbarum]|uniref:Hemolysin XhlA n=1 Tax=Cohnella herbarum TaxID=2728023 RepID=A0A7Z2VEK4_9BACL|nr:hemolysin XhlA family protein [Cohnella herbarum]QJD81731.1 hemolysin XhlA [Cohnella herbarum]